MFQYPFMQHAFIAGTIIAVMCGVIGVYVVARGLGLLAHAFSDIGFSGGAFAIYMGWEPLKGLLLFTTIGAIVIGRLGTKAFQRNVAISVVLSISLGLGLLFLSLSSKMATATFALLFGSIIGISADQVMQIAILSSVILAVMFIGYRILTFDSFDPTGSESARLKVRWISIAFVLLLSVAVGEAMQIVGALLVFTLMSTPASAARHLTNSIFRMIVYSALFSIIGVWAGLTLSFYTNAPVSFYIAVVEGLLYFAALGWQALRERLKPRSVSISSLSVGGSE